MQIKTTLLEKKREHSRLAPTPAAPSPPCHRRSSLQPNEALHLVDEVGEPDLESRTSDSNRSDEETCPFCRAKTARVALGHRNMAGRAKLEHHHRIVRRSAALYPIRIGERRFQRCAEHLEIYRHGIGFRLITQIACPLIANRPPLPSTDGSESDHTKQARLSRRPS
jgi:hypothetical protein